MSEEWRILLYPLGIVSTLAFTLRFVIQWLQSERAHKSLVTAPFWWLSIFGNLMLGLHALIQGQYPVCIVQVINGTIACRNLNLMHSAAKQWSLKSTIVFLLSGMIFTTLTFWLTNGNWFRIPAHSLQHTSQISSVWHLIGTAGVILFASRFWIQWMQAEKAQKSSLQAPFWWLSLIGASLSIIYFALIRDYVNLVGPLFGLIPYCRNLILLRKE